MTGVQTCALPILFSCIAIFDKSYHLYDKLPLTSSKSYTNLHQQKSRPKRQLSCTNKSLKPFVGLLAVELLYFVFVSSGFSHELTYDYISRSSNSASSWRDFFAKSLSVSVFSASFSTESLVAFSTSLSTAAESASSRSSLLTIFRL